VNEPDLSTESLPKTPLNEERERPRFAEESLTYCGSSRSIRTLEVSVERRSK